MTPPKGSATYKKKDGTLVLSKDLQSVSWTPVAPPGASSALTISVSAITNLQQTPASSPKVMLKVFAQQPDASTPETYTFSFTSSTAARSEADAIKDALSKSIQAAKAPSAAPGTPAGTSGAPGAMAIASAVSSTSSGWYDDARLKADLELQQSLLKADPSLQKTFMESLRTKPESISNSQFTSQFWAMRLPMLRAHATEKSQTRGAYNVLSTIKAKTEDNVTRLSISKEQIQLIFNQHPLVKRVYDENVPKLNESVFWSKFFLSRLFKKLKGEKIVESDPLDPVLDRYLNYEEDRSKQILGAHVPHIIDIEGNEENHSQRKGNAPDMTMRPAAGDKVPIIRTLNNLSERIMAHVAPIDVDPSEPIGMDEETFNELALRDLQGDAKENRIILNIKDQKRFFQDDKENGDSDDAARYARQDAQEVLSGLRVDLDPELMDSDAGGGLKLRTAIGVNEDSDSDEDAEMPKVAHVGSRASIADATKQILGAISQRRSQTDDLSSSAPGFNTIQTSTSGLTPALFDRLTLTHATTTEFLHHFWLVFLSGDPDRAGEIGKLAESLDRAMDRIQAVANDAEEERREEVDRRKREIRDMYQATGKKVKWKPDSVGGGAKVVNEMLAPTVRAVGTAIARYKKALALEGVQAEAAGV
ncbi:MAG: RNA polymerase II transcription factor B subunit 1 [Thelocarpon impressellum]|nr:MAG: RNA polymerase II transcription factor B subunit 1 [Thelocarpon impressellum]